MPTERQFIAVRIAVLTVSDTRTLADDKSGDALVERLTGAGHLLAARAIVPDDVEAIRAQVTRWIDARSKPGWARSASAASTAANVGAPDG